MSSSTRVTGVLPPSSMGDVRLAPEESRRALSDPAAHILVVEDQDDVRRMLLTALELEGHQVDEAGNAREGLRRIQQQRYDLVLSDYAMPGETGAWMLRQAADQGLMDGTIAVIITAHPYVEDLGAAIVLAKPLDLDLFLEQIRALLTGALRATRDPAGQNSAALDQATTAGLNNSRMDSSAPVSSRRSRAKQKRT